MTVGSERIAELPSQNLTANQNSIIYTKYINNKIHTSHANL